MELRGFEPLIPRCQLPAPRSAWAICEVTALVRLNFAVYQLDACTALALGSILVGRTLTARQVIRRIEELGGYHVRTRGSHATYEAVKRDEHQRVVLTARAQVPIHSGDVAPGTLRSIQRQLAPVFGEGWLIK